MVKNFAKLILFFCFSFIGILLLAGFLALMQETARASMAIPALLPAANSETAASAGNKLVFLRNSLPAAFYLSILLGINYAFRRRLMYPVVFVVMLVFSLVFSTAAFFSIESLSNAEKFDINAKTLPAELIQPGLILDLGAGNQTVFLEDPLKEDGSRIVSAAGQAMHYEKHGPSLDQSPLFAEEKSALFDSIKRDFTQSSQNFSDRFIDGLMPFWVYAGSLAFFLLSLGCLVNVSYWSLANLFFAVLIFRGALALEVFLVEPNIHDLLASSIGSIIPESSISPFIFGMLGGLILIYSGLVYLAKGRVSNV